MFPSNLQFPNPINKIGGYLGNVGKEAKQYGKAWAKSFDASAGIGPGADQKAFNANVKERQAQGQLLGAVLQGRRYDNKGNQIVNKASKSK